MTQTGRAASPPPSPLPPPPPPSVVPEPAPEPGPSRAAGRFQDTPGRMRLVTAVLVVAGLLVGLLAAQSFWSVDRALVRAGENAAQLVRLQEVQTRLVSADAGATNAFLVGGLEPADQRQDYDDAMAGAAEQLAYAARAQPADGEALAALNGVVQDYAATIQAARANNRQGLPVGSQYQRNASAALRADALPLLEALGAANEARAEAEFGVARRDWLGLVTGCVVGLGALAAASVWLARRTHRYVNVPVAGSAVVVLLVLAAGALVLGSVAGAVGAVRAGSYAAARAVSDARIAAFDAKSNESLTLIARGSGAAFEEAWVDSADTTAARLADATGISASSADLEPAWNAYADLHRQIRALDDGGEWEAAVAAATSRADGSANAAFAAFDDASGERLARASEATSGELRSARSGLVLGGWLCLLAGGLAAVLAWWGLRQRIEEYR